jgi:hypothetical protein
MDKVYPLCAGLDVHKDSVFAAARVNGRQFIEKFGTTSAPSCCVLATGWPATA